jgi:hypothetical protein
VLVMNVSTGPVASPEYRMKMAPKKREPAKFPQTVCRAKRTHSVSSPYVDSQRLLIVSYITLFKGKKRTRQRTDDEIVVRQPPPRDPALDDAEEHDHHVRGQEFRSDQDDPA